MPWPAMPSEEVQRRVQAALALNRSYRSSEVLGLPGTVLDQRVFPATPEVVARAWLHTAVENPNHIGCHTLGDGEPVFAGTQALERDALRLCAEEVMGAEPGEVDGYVASGGTESNVQALWELRNRWRDVDEVPSRAVGVLCSVDTHYSAHKAADLLGLAIELVPVDPWTRAMARPAIDAALDRLLARGITRVVPVLNMGTTMFGSVDDPAPVFAALADRGVPFAAHVDAAFGGFVYPFTRPDQPLSFRDPRIATVTMDAHKMLQAPYGTGIHLARRGLLKHTTTRTATYVPGLDCTLCGSRSGANAVAVWMILRSWGSEGGARFVQELVDRAERLVRALGELGLRTVHTPGMNIVALRDEDVPAEISTRFLLVPDRHDRPAWRKIVVMEHVTDAALDHFLTALAQARR